MEVLVALFILSTALLGIAGLELTALHNTQESYLQSIATIQVASMFERLRAHSTNLNIIAQCDDWNVNNQMLLPQGKGQCICNKNDCTVTIEWFNKKLQLFSMKSAV